MTVRTPPPARSKADKLRALIDHPTTPEGEKIAARKALDNLLAKGKADTAPSSPPHAPPDFDGLRDLFSRYARSGWPSPGFSFYGQARSYTRDEAPPRAPSRPRGEHDWTKDHARCGKSDHHDFMDGWTQGASDAPHRSNASQAYRAGYQRGHLARGSAEGEAGRWQPEPSKAWRYNFDL